MDFLKCALKYAAAGIATFPLHPGQKLPCIKGGHAAYDATTDITTIEEWGKLYPQANIAFHPYACKVPLVGLDFDNKSSAGIYGEHPNGLDTLEEMLLICPELSEAWIAETGNGGRHYLFTAPDDLDLDNHVRIAQGLDIRFKGGYLVCAPSHLTDGGTYRWLKKVGEWPPMLPQAVVGMLHKALAERRAPRTSVAPSDGSQDDESPIHERHSVLHRMGASMRSRGLDQYMIKAALMVANERRCQPGPLPESEIDRIVRHNLNLQPYLDPIAEAKALAHRRLAKPQIHIQKADPFNGQKPIVFRKASEIRQTEVDWLIPGYFARGKFNLLWGQPGKGKSYACTGLASLISRGEPLPGELHLGNRKPGRAVILAYEDDVNDTITPRLRLCGADMDLVEVMHYEDNSVTSRDIDRLFHALDKIPDLQLVVIDPLTSYANGISAVDNTAVKSNVTEPLINKMFGKPYALIGIMHSNKNVTVASASRLSGAGAWEQGARSVILAGHDNLKENSQFHTYGGMIPTKGNLSGINPPLTYEIDNGKFKFTGTDASLNADRLFPLPLKKVDK